MNNSRSTVRYEQRLTFLLFAVLSADIESELIGPFLVFGQLEVDTAHQQHESSLSQIEKTTKTQSFNLYFR